MNAFNQSTASGRIARRTVGFAALGLVLGLFVLAMPSFSKHFAVERAAVVQPGSLGSVVDPQAAKVNPATGSTLTALHASIKGEPEELPPQF